MARKPKMRTVEQYLCDKCDCIIANSDHESPEGFVIHGNIYVADPSKKAGIIGNNFPEVAEGEKIESSQVKQTVLCKSCFINAVLNTSDNPYNSPKSHKKTRDIFDTIRPSTLDVAVAPSRRRVGRSANREVGEDAPRGELTVNIESFMREPLPNDPFYDDGGAYTA